MRKSRDEARAQLRAIEDDLLRCWAWALREFVEKYGQLRARMSKRSEASVINDLVLDQVREVFGEDHPYAHARRIGNLSYLDVDVGGGGKFIIRFKKLSRALSASNIHTQSVLRFMQQRQAQEPRQLELPTIEKPLNLFVGYQPADVSLLDSRIFVVCPDHFRIAWFWELTRSADVVELPRQQRSAAAKRSGRRVRPKRQSRPKVTDDNNL